MKKRTKAFEVSLRPYNGRLWFAPTRKAYERARTSLFKDSDPLPEDGVGRFSWGEGKDGMWTYLIWAESPHILAHETAHVVLSVFERCGIDPREAGGEPFCYMQSQIILDINSKKKP